MRINVRMAKDGKSAIIMTGYLHVARYENNYNKLMNFINEFNTYVVKHCDREDIPTHIVKDGFVNRYGILITNEELQLGEDGSMPFPKGKYLREQYIPMNKLRDMLNGD